MISHVRGTVFSKGLNGAVVDVGGIGYSLTMAATSAAALPQVGDEATVFVSMQVRDDGISLYGFLDEQERYVFEKLITVNGVGPKVAINALSTFPAPELARVIASGDASKVAKVPGIGKKGAQRIIVDLKGVFEAVPSDAEGMGEVQLPVAESSEAVMALLSMGFTDEEAQLALAGYTGSDDLQEIVRYALKRLGGA